MGCFNKPMPRSVLHSQQGFTLLEVMLAVALIAVVMVSLLGSQSQSIAIAGRAKFDVVASLLAQQKMAELCTQEFDALGNEDGDFEDDYPEFSWKAEVQSLDDDDTGLEGADGMLKSLEVTVFLTQNEEQTFTVKTIVFRKNEAVDDDGT